jgi:hypothetical protein
MPWKFWKRRSRTEELLERIDGFQEDHSIYLNSISDSMDQQVHLLSKCLDRLSRPTGPPRTEAVILDDAIREIRNIVETIKGEPFSALHTWISESVDRERRHDQTIRSLLDRWEKQVDQMAAAK